MGNWLTDYVSDFFGRLPSDMKLRSSKTKVFCEISLKNDMLTRHLTSELQYDLDRFSDVYMDALSKSLRLPREKHFEPQKVLRDPGASTILTSKSRSRRSVMQVLPTWTSKSAENMPVFNDFDFEIALSPHVHAAHICACTSLCWQFLGGSSQYSRKLDS